MMDFSSDFTLPLNPSQNIDSGSEAENSPIFKRRKRPSQEALSSPVIISKRRKESSLQTQPKVARRSLGCEFMTSCELLSENPDKVVIDEVDEDDAIEASPSPLIVEMKSQTPTSSQMVSSCHSSLGLLPQPLENKNYSLMATSMVSNMVESSSEGSNECVDTNDESNVSMANLLGSGKKRKPVKNGLLQHLQKLLDQKKSKESLERYLRNNDPIPSAEVKLKVVNVSRFHDILIIHGDDQDVLINNDFIVDCPSVGDVITFTHPRLSKVVRGRRMLLGALSFSIEKSDCDQGRAEVMRESRHKTLRCPCLRLTNITNQEVKCLEADWSFENHDSAAQEDSLIHFCSSDSSSAEGNSHLSLTLTVADIVSKFGGSSSSPQTSFALSRNKKLSLELLVHGIFFYGHVDSSPSLVCEDCSGDFIIIKIPLELREESRWQQVFNQDWFALVGSTISLKSPFNIQDRLTRGHDGKVFSLLDSFKDTNQRYCYVFKCFPGSSYEILYSNSTHIALQPIPDHYPESGEIRSNCQVRIICQHSRMLYASSTEGIVTDYKKIAIRKSFCEEKFLSGVVYPVEAVLRGLVTDQSGNHFVDGFSCIITDMVCNSFDISHLPAPSPSSQPGDLVKIEGMVSRIDEQQSLQWMECTLCGSDEMVQSDDTTWSCVTCDQVSIPEHKMELVCRVANTWTRLRSESAKSILPSGDLLSEFHTADIIGQVIAPILAVIGNDMIADECKVNI